MTRKDIEIAIGLHALSLIQAAYVLTDGRIGSRVGTLPILLLRTRGRKTGLLRTAALLYADDAGRPVVVASRGGSDQAPAWFLNLRADPHAEVQIGRRRWPVAARVTGGEERERLWAKVNRQWDYRAYQRRTRRQIPVVVLEPAD